MGSVHRLKNTLRKEKLFVKAAMGQLDALQDTNLHDLRTLHNRSIRTRSGSNGAEPACARSKSTASEALSRRRQHQDKRNGRSRMARCEAKNKIPMRGQVVCQMHDPSSSNQMKELCQALDSSIQHHCVSFGVPEDLGLHQIRRCSTNSDALHQDLRDLYAACVRMDVNSNLSG